MYPIVFFFLAVLAVNVGLWIVVTAHKDVYSADEMRSFGIILILMGASILISGSCLLVVV